MKTRPVSAAFPSGHFVARRRGDSDDSIIMATADLRCSSEREVATRPSIFYFFFYILSE